MKLLKKFLKIFLFSILQTIAIPFGLLPYGLFILPYAFIVSFMIFFAPIFISAATMHLAFPEIPQKYKHKIFGKLTAMVSLAIALNLIYNHRGSGEYFGNQAATYIQLGFAAFVGYWVWLFLAGIIFSEEYVEQSIDTIDNATERIKFSRSSILISNLILGNIVLLFSESDINFYSRLPICVAFSIAAFLIFYIFLRKIKTKTPHSTFRNGILGVIATMLVPIVGTSLYDFDVRLGLFSGFIGIIVFAKYWIPMAILNGYLFIHYENSINHRQTLTS